MKFFALKEKIAYKRFIDSNIDLIGTSRELKKNKGFSWKQRCIIKNNKSQRIVTKIELTFLVTKKRYFPDLHRELTLRLLRKIRLMPFCW